MAARCRLGILQSWLAVLQSCLSILQSRPVSPQSSPRRSSVLALYFDQLRARFTESTPPAAAKSHVSFAGFAPSRRFARCKKQKSRHFCNFFVFEPLDGFRTGLDHPGKTTMRAGRSARPQGHPRGRSCGLTMQDGLGRSHKATHPQHCKTKKRGHPTSDALALFSNGVAPTLALTPYSRTQVPSGDRIPRLYA